LEDFQINYEQSLISRLIHFFKSNDTDELFKMYASARKNFGKGGIKRFNYTFPSLICSYLKLASTISKNDIKTEFDNDKVFQYLNETITALSPHNQFLSFNFYLESALCADKCNFYLKKGNSPKNLYNFLSESFILFEEIDSKLKIEYLSPIVNTVQILNNISTNNYTNLTEKLCDYGKKLIRLQDQCISFINFANLFYPMKNNVKKFYLKKR
jgi:vacuolar protein sorting-associated protein 35